MESYLISRSSDKNRHCECKVLLSGSAGAKSNLSVISEIATHLAGARNDMVIKGLRHLSLDLGNNKKS